MPRVAAVAASPVWSRSRPVPTPMPWATPGRVVAGMGQVLGLVAVFWLLMALPGVLSARDSTVEHGKRPAAAMVARR